MKIRLRPLLAGLTALGVPLSAYGQSFLIDQHNDPPVPPNILRYWAAHPPFNPPIGQEFKPSLNSLDFVDLRTHAGGGAATGTFEIRIHAGSIAAPVLATSTPNIMTNGDETVVHFEFPSSVSLIPGDLYVMEFAQVEFGSAWGIGATGDTYAQGQMIWRGEPNADDLWFREGVVVVPEPSVTLIGSIGVMIMSIFGKCFLTIPNKKRCSYFPFLPLKSSATKWES
jgi:hypothetical protein